MDLALPPPPKIHEISLFHNSYSQLEILRIAFRSGNNLILLHFKLVPVVVYPCLSNDIHMLDARISVLYYDVLDQFV